jgi:hypothetical protein
MTADDIRPPIPASLAHRPVRGGLAQAWVNAQLADGGTDFRSPHTARYEEAWRRRLCQSCGKPTGTRAVLVCGPRQVLTLRFDEPPACPPCVPYISKACPFVSGRSVTYPDRRRITEGHRGEKCADPACDCSGWQASDPEHSADMGGQPNLPWYAAWIMPGEYQLTGHTAKIRCSDLGCEHDRTFINGAVLRRLPLKVQLLSEPGRKAERRTLTSREALEHAAAAIEAAGVKPAERSPLWDGRPLPLLPSGPRQEPKPAKAPRKRRARDVSAMSLSELKQARGDVKAKLGRLKDLKDEIGRIEDGGAP